MAPLDNEESVCGQRCIRKHDKVYRMYNNIEADLIKDYARELGQVPDKL